MPLPGESVTDTSLQGGQDPDPAGDDDQYDGDDPSGEVDDGDGDGVDPAGEGEGEGSQSEDPFSEYGGKEAVDRALQFHKHVQDPDGALETFFQLGRSFGLGVREIEALFGQQVAQQGQQQEQQQGPGDDDVMTYAEFKRLIDSEIKQPMQQQQQAQQRQAAQATVQSTVKELGIEDDQTKAAVLQLGDRYLQGNDLSPEAVANAVRRGHADFIALVQSNADKYRKSKAAAAKRVPKPVKGAGSPAGNVEEEPKDVKEAIARARKRLLS